MNFEQALLEKVKAVMSSWDEPDIYAISFFVYHNSAYTYKGYENISTFAVSYNTESDCPEADLYDEERWNYAFWRQDETPIIDPDEPEAQDLTARLFAWYAELGLTNIGEEDETNSYDRYGNYIGQGPVGHRELLMAVARTARALQEEDFVEKHFGQKLPIIVHGLEYAPYDMEATSLANPHGEAEVFFKAAKEMGIL